MIDHTNLWRTVYEFCSVQTNASRGSESDSRSDLDPTGSLQGFASQTKSGKSAEDDENANHNLVIYGISNEILAQRGTAVRTIIEGTGVYLLANQVFIGISKFERVLAAARSLNRLGLANSDVFHIIINGKLSIHTYYAMQRRICILDSHSSLPSLKHLRARILNLLSLKPRHFDYCPNSCICYAGSYATLSECPECYLSRDPTGINFSYVPLIPRLRAIFSPPKIQAMKYRYQLPLKVDDTYQHIAVGYDGELGSGKVVDAQTVR